MKGEIIVLVKEEEEEAGAAERTTSTKKKKKKKKNKKKKRVYRVTKNEAARCAGHDTAIRLGLRFFFEGRCWKGTRWAPNTLFRAPGTGPNTGQLASIRRISHDRSTSTSSSNRPLRLGVSFSNLETRGISIRIKNKKRKGGGKKKKKRSERVKPRVPVL